MIGYCVFYNIRLKQYNESGLRAEEDLELKNQLRALLLEKGIDLSNKIFVNGHFTKEKVMLVRMTTFYSYVLVFHPDSGLITVYNYLPDESELQFVGDFALEQITAKPYASVGTNYLFHDQEGKHLFTVQTLAEDLPGSSEYQLSYGQREEYEALRKRLGLT